MLTETVIMHFVSTVETRDTVKRLVSQYNTSLYIFNVPEIKFACPAHFKAFVLATNIGSGCHPFKNTN